MFNVEKTLDIEFQLSSKHKQSIYIYEILHTSNDFCVNVKHMSSILITVYYYEHVGFIYTREAIQTN